jgi:hypothetical protein
VEAQPVGQDARARHLRPRIQGVAVVAAIADREEAVKNAICPKASVIMMKCTPRCGWPPPRRQREDEAPHRCRQHVKRIDDTQVVEDHHGIGAEAIIAHAPARPARPADEEGQRHRRHRQDHGARQQVST